MTKFYNWEEELKNTEIFNYRVKLYNRIPGPRVGDYIIRLDGSISRGTYDFSDKIQDGGNQSSFYLGEGYISYSGGLNPGIEKSKLKDTGNKKDGWIWFFKNDYATANNGINYLMEFRVFEEIGIKQEWTCKYCETTNGKAFKDCFNCKEPEVYIEKVTTYNGNDQPHERELPKVIIVQKHPHTKTEHEIKCNDSFLTRINKNTGLSFKKCYSGYEAQPTQANQIVRLLMTHNFNIIYHDNWNDRNTLFMRINDTQRPFDL